MTFYELLLQGEAIGDAGDLEEAIATLREARPEELSWQQLCTDPESAPIIRRYRSFEAFLDNEDAVETIRPTAAMLEPESESESQSEPEWPSESQPDQGSGPERLDDPLNGPLDN